MKKVSFEQLGLVNLSAEETQEINGGEIGTWLKKAGIAGLAYDVIDNWSTIKKGFLAGWNSLK
ncbi:MAG TPA: hypothetical protein VJA82_06990 [Sediminibacterium sp.]|uniref:hypothetical protein n=1 Tax=Sediminibacterium sp. TaxID=1917865 RepID=UPI0008B583E8|nr:hypothetical protein [Sediminibacterium sp.]OHC84586.1 MAG: hypothetical protein A2472_11545 [Sphingobacteriia bacterium RIFOXYC2_FULL_35_18]OHC87507.1 MAG: hypothetical protein A2546_07960 [Sphingobacteriia bacterium RIFOXYD2_FULL_35_12]HLD53029.1 hypothetical protein [Sediminibacterium sp.]